MRQEARSLSLAGAPQPPSHSDFFPLNSEPDAALQGWDLCELFLLKKKEKKKQCFPSAETAAWWQDNSKSPKSHSSKSYKSCKGMVCKQGLTPVKDSSWASQDPACSRKARSECHKEELSLKEAVGGGHYLFWYPTAGGLLPCSLEFEEAKSYSAVPSNTGKHFVPSAMAVPSRLSQKENQRLRDISC